MATWDSYTQKSTPADNDTLMIKDTSGGANKRTPFSGVWNWIVSKLASAVISQLETTNKSIIPAINELNSKSFKKITRSQEVTIEIPKSVSFLIVAGRSSGNAGRNIYAGSSNASGIYSFAKLAGTDTNLTESNDGESVTFTASAWIEVMYVTT